MKSPISERKKLLALVTPVAFRMFKNISSRSMPQSKLTLSVPVTCTRLPLLVGVEIRSKGRRGKKKGGGTKFPLIDDGMMSIPACPVDQLQTPPTLSS